MEELSMVEDHGFIVGDVYDINKYKIENKLLPTLISFLEWAFPDESERKIEIIENFNKENQSTKEDQCNHIDIRITYKGLVYAIDAKCCDSKDGYYSCAIYEMYRTWKQADGSYGKILDGWMHTKDIDGVPPERQIVMRVTSKEITVVRKSNYWNVVKKYPEEFELHMLDVVQDSGNKNKYDFNKKLYYNNKYNTYKHRNDLKLMQEMNIKKYQLCDGSWHQVPIEKLGNQ